MCFSVVQEYKLQCSCSRNLPHDSPWRAPVVPAHKWERNTFYISVALNGQTFRWDRRAQWNTWREQNNMLPFVRQALCQCLPTTISVRKVLTSVWIWLWVTGDLNCLLSSQKASCFLHKWDPQVDGLGLRAVVLRTWFDRWDSKAAPIPLPLYPCTRRNDAEEQKYTCQTHGFCTALGFPLNLLDLEQSPYLLLLAMLWLFISPRHFFHDWMPVRNSCESIVGHVQKPWLYKIKKNKQLMGASMMA